MQSWIVEVHARGTPMTTLTLPKQGYVLAGKYRIERTLGEGGMGVVYEAFHLRLRQRVAIKVLRPAILVHPEFVGRFEREARAAATLESPNVAKVLDVDTTPDGLTYMVIELLQGNDLGEELTRRGRLPIQEAVGYVMEACAPIAEAHALGIIHRDLKPSNLFLAKKGNGRTLKLLDFGISKVLTEVDAKSTSPLTTLGTPHYMSPEHVRNAADVDRRSDIWSLGVILYELLTGTEPYSGDPTQVIAAIVADPVPTPRTRRPDLPAELEAVIMRALEKDPRKRFPDVRALATALAPFAGEEELVPASVAQHLPAAPSVRPPPNDSNPPITRDQPTVIAPRARPRWVLPAGVALGVTLGMVLVWWALSAAREPARAVAATPKALEAPTRELVVMGTAEPSAPTVQAPALPSASAAPIASSKVAPHVEPAASIRRRRNPLTL